MHNKKKLKSKMIYTDYGRTEKERERYKKNSRTSGKMQTKK